MTYRRYKLVISAPALISAAVFAIGLLAILLYSLVVINGQVGSRFIISINLQTLIMYLLSLVLICFFTFSLIKRKRK